MNRTVSVRGSASAPRSAHTRPRPLWRIAVVLFASVAFHSGAAAQEPTESLSAELARLAALVDSLSREVARLTEAGQAAAADDPLARLRAAAEAAAAGGPPATAEVPGDQEFVGRQRSLQALNPEIGVSADIFGHLNKDDAGENNFFAREFEVSLISNLDPFSRAKVFFSHHGAGAEIAPFEDAGHAHAQEEGGGGFGVEEGYVAWVGLPGGLRVKLGKFLQQFGQLNRWHAHALPFQSRSLPHLAYIGEEALSQSGVSVHWLAPFGGSGGTWEATLEVTRSGNETLFGEAGDVSVLGHLNGFWNLSASADFDLGVSWIRGTYMDDHNAGDRDLYGAEMAFTWRPPGQSRYRGFTLRGGVMALNGLIHEEEHDAEEEHESEDESEEEVSALADEGALGWWSAGEFRLSQSWLVGGRFDRVQNPEDTRETAWVMSPTLTWWQSEYVRLRLEYDVLGRSSGPDSEGHLFLQVTMAMGPHKHESY